MRVIASPPVQQQLDALIDEAHKAGCVVTAVELTPREFDAMLDASAMPLRGNPYSTYYPRISKYRGYIVQEVR